MGSRTIYDIDPRIFPRVCKFLADCTDQGIPLMIINVLRSEEEQIENIKNGVSWTANSKHLPQDTFGKSFAIDVCPYEVFQLHGPDKLQWNTNDLVWEKIGEIGKATGAVWGGDWKQKDMGHFQWNP